MCVTHSSVATGAALTTENNRFSTVPRLRFNGNEHTKPMPSNELFRLSRVMSQYHYMEHDLWEIKQIIVLLCQ
jgi:hypothetical protein